MVHKFLEHSNEANTRVPVLESLNNPKSIETTLNAANIVNLIECFLVEARESEKNPKEHLKIEYLRLFLLLFNVRGGH